MARKTSISSREPARGNPSIVSGSSTTVRNQASPSCEDQAWPNWTVGHALSS